MPDQHKCVLIIGAGLGGLALAQGLKRHNIPFHVFESDPDPTFRPQGYRVRINADDTAGLREVVSEELWTRFEKVCAATLEGGCRLDAITGNSVKPQVGPGGGPPIFLGPKYCADRTVTRDLLLRGLGSEVSFGKRSQSYEQEVSGVTAHFVDGSSETGALIVGAEGRRSVVRKQYLPDHVILDTEARCIYGKTLITPALTSRFPAQGMQGISLLMDAKEYQKHTISEKHKIVLFFEAMRFQDTDLRSGLPEDYIYWVLAADKSVFGVAEDEVHHMRGKAAADLSLKITEHWHADLKVVLELQETEQTSFLNMQVSMPDMPVWEPSAHVTLIGDAAHCMPPMGGVGANTALQDAAKLSGMLQKGITAEAVNVYESDMRDRAEKAIRGSMQGGKHMIGMKGLSELTPLRVW